MKKNVINRALLALLVTSCTTLAAAQEIEPGSPMAAAASYVGQDINDKQAREGLRQVGGQASQAQADANAARAAANRANSGVRRLGRELKGVRKDTNKLGTRVGALEKSDVSQNAATAKLKTDLDQLDQDTATSLQGINGKLDDPKTGLEALGKRQKTQGDQIKGLSKSITNALSALGDVATVSSVRWFGGLVLLALVVGYFASKKGFHEAFRSFTGLETEVDDLKTATSLEVAGLKDRLTTLEGAAAPVPIPAPAPAVATPAGAPMTPGGGAPPAPAAAPVAAAPVAAPTPVPAPAPVITRVTPNTGPVAGGTVSVVIGNNFHSAAKIELKEVAPAVPTAPVTVTGATITARKITFTWPILSASGAYTLIVTLPDGQKVETTVNAT